MVLKHYSVMPESIEKTCIQPESYVIIDDIRIMGLKHGKSRIMYELEVCSDGTTEAQPRSFRQNRPTASTLSDIMQVQHMSRKIRENTRECRNVSVFGKTLGVHGCTLTHEVLQHEESQIRQERSFVSFSKHVRSLSIPVTPFENEMKTVSSLHPMASAEAVNFEFTLLKKTASTEETIHRSR